MGPKLAIALPANLPDYAGDSPIAQPDTDNLSAAAAVQPAYRRGTSQPQPGALTIPSGSGMNYTGQNESLREHPGRVLVTWGYGGMGVWGYGGMGVWGYGAKESCRKKMQSFSPKSRI